MKIAHFLILLSFSYASASQNSSDSEIESPPAENELISIKHPEDKHLMIYRNLFKVKRKEHLAAVQKLILNKDIAKRTEMIRIMFQAIIKTIKSAMGKLRGVDLSETNGFPTDENVQNDFSQVLENTAFFADLIIRFPQISRPLFNQNRKVWGSQMRLAIDMCHQSPVYEGDYQTLLHNLRQELKIGEVDKTYVNPFVLNPDDIKEATTEERKELYQEAKRKQKLKSKKNNKKKPKQKINKNRREL